MDLFSPRFFRGTGRTCLNELAPLKGFQVKFRYLDLYEFSQHSLYLLEFYVALKKIGVVCQRWFSRSVLSRGLGAWLLQRFNRNLSRDLHGYMCGISC